MTITPGQLDALRTIAWGVKHFGALVTGRSVTLRTVRVLVARGLVESAGLVALCDEDGFLLQPERWRRGFRLSVAGRDFLDKHGFKVEVHRG